jgi:excisionase family DNA binding protein
MSTDQVLQANTAKLIQGERFVRSRDLAKWLGVSTPTVCRWARTGKLPAFRLNGRIIIFDQNEILKHLGQSRLQ